mgnify:CR=1 FL=1
MKSFSKFAKKIAVLATALFGWGIAHGQAQHALNQEAETDSKVVIYYIGSRVALDIDVLGYEAASALLEDKLITDESDSTLYAWDIKVFATAATNGSGGVGGIFAPTMFIGGISGFFLARLIAKELDK